MSRREHHHALHEIAQLAHVPRPRILHEHLHRVRRDPVERPVVLRRELLDEPAHEERDVLAPLAQRRQINAEHVQPVVEVGRNGPSATCSPAADGSSP